MGPINYVASPDQQSKIKIKWKNQALCVCFFLQGKCTAFLVHFVIHPILTNYNWALSSQCFLVLPPGRNTGPSAAMRGAGEMHTVSRWNYVWETGLVL